MFDFFYNVSLGIYLFLMIPVLVFKFKKYRSTLVERFFFLKKKTSVPKDKKVVWVHAVSLGETKVAALLIKKLKEENKDTFFVVSNVTKTGYEEAKKSIPCLDYHLYLPLDFSWTMKRMMAFFKPHLVILTETDFWYNFLKYAKVNGATIALINGKISDTSFKRFKTFSFIKRRIFSYLDIYLVQDDLYLKRFLELDIPPNKIYITGNLKFDLKNKMLSKEERQTWIKAFKLNENDKIITIASTHSNEEELLLEKCLSLKKMDDKYKFFLVPRHPERFPTVKDLLKKNNIAFGTYSEIDKLNGSEMVILIDTMGLLNVCYALSSLGVVGGSFVKHVGGHNVLEPVFCETPVFFGPFMYSQEEMRSIVLKTGCGEAVSLENILERISEFFDKTKDFQKEKCAVLKKSLSGQADKTIDILKKYY